MTDLYQSQRAMRNMRRAAMQRGVVAILDVGTSKIACLVLRFDGADVVRDGDSVAFVWPKSWPGRVMRARPENQAKIAFSG